MLDCIPEAPSLRYLSVCSGIEAASEAWRPLGWQPVMLSEIEAFPRAVLKHRHGAVDVRETCAAGQGVPLWGDFTAIRPRHFRRLGIPFPEILVGGCPCQAFSIAGLRKSLDDDRGNLTLQFIRLAHALRSTGFLRGFLYENVPGILSTPDNAFGCFLGGAVGADDALLPCPRPAVGKSGPCWRWDAKTEKHIPSWPSYGMVAGPLSRLAWRVLDSQWFGVPQRRRRVFVVASFADGFDPAEILFEPRGLRRNTKARQKTRQDFAGTIGSRTSSGGRYGAGFEYGGGVVAETLRAGGNRTGGDRPPGTDADTAATYLIPVAFGGSNTSGPIEVATAGGGSETLIAFNSREDPVTTGDVAGALGSSSPQAQAIAFSCKDYGADAGETAPTLRAMGHAGSHANAGGQLAIAVSLRGREGGATAELSGDVMPALRTGGGGGDKPHALTQMGVRRLTPVEAERLQGFSDNYTRIPWRGRPEEECPDGPRYRAVGNSMTVDVMRWLGQRIDKSQEKSRKK
jgi:DNA (cytosine-5)-methyltransferase 1